MIRIEKSSAGFIFCIGAHRIEMDASAVNAMAAGLTEGNAPLIVAGKMKVQSGDWVIENAHDDNPNRESRARILLHAGNLKWHLTDQEVVALGEHCRSLI
jgi:hypothetical protein